VFRNDYSGPMKNFITLDSHPLAGLLAAQATRAQQRNG
jgi:hypothetical protein